jgi:putative phosphoesterase
MKRVGVISDTHGLMRPEALTALAGVDLILHAGDVGKPEVLQRLAAVAPVEAVRGNVDTGDWARTLPERLEVKVEEARLLLLHDASQAMNAEDYDAVVTGHTHKAVVQVRGGVVFLNPGSAGPRRFQLPVTVMRLVIDGSRITSEIVTLDLAADR